MTSPGPGPIRRHGARSRSAEVAADDGATADAHSRAGSARRHEPRDQLVFAVRTDPPPDPAVQQQGLLRWWRVDELNMPFDRWRAALHRVARRGHVRVHTFRVPPTVPDRDDDPDQLVYAVWIDPADPRQTPAAFPARPPAVTPRARRGPSPVTNLTDYRAGHSRRATSIARHPSQHSKQEDDAGEVDR